MRRNDLLCGESIARDIARVFTVAGHVYTLLPFNRDLDEKALDDLNYQCDSSPIFCRRCCSWSQFIHSPCYEGRSQPSCVLPYLNMFSRTRLDNVFAITDTVVETVSDVSLDRFRTNRPKSTSWVSQARGNPPGRNVWGRYSENRLRCHSSDYANGRRSRLCTDIARSTETSPGGDTD